MFLSDYTSEPYLYNSETLAKDACIARAECNGVTQEALFTLRMGKHYMNLRLVRLVGN